MWLTRDFCFFIVVEQIILGNLLLVRSVSNLATEEHFIEYRNPNFWAQIPIAYIQILVSIILLQGLLERKSGKFMPWIIVNALGCVVFSVVIIDVVFYTSIIPTVFQIRESDIIIYNVMAMILVFQWIAWIIVLLYYRHLKLKEIKCNAEKVVKDENVENPTEQAIIVQHPKMTDHSQLCNVQFTQHEREEHIPINRLYPTATALDL